MQAPTEEVGWVVTVLLTIAAIVINIKILAGTGVGIVLMIILLAICAVLALRYE